VFASDAQELFVFAAHEKLLPWKSASNIFRFRYLVINSFSW
jgi:hypothetical protein